MSADSPTEVVTLEDMNALAHEGARRFAEAAQAAERTGEFRVALSGGSTPRAMYEVLAREPYRSSIDWSGVHVFFSDERFVPPDSPQSNYLMARTELLEAVPLPAKNIHTVPTIGLEPEAAAEAYQDTILSIFGEVQGLPPSFDLILLGLGPDGHTASLFPGTSALGEQKRLVAANYVEAQQGWRITFTYPLLNAAAQVLFLVQGDEKATRVREVFDGNSALPAARVRPTNGRLVWLLDTAAASQLQAPS